MSKERELLERSLYFLEPSDWEEDSDTSRTCIKLSREIQELLAQPETKQEPVAWMNDSGGCFLSDGNKYSENWTALYTSPPKREPLSDYATYDMFRASKQAVTASCYWAGIRDAEKAHGIGGGE